MKKEQYHSKSSAKYLLKIHLILVCKYRKQLLIETGDYCKQAMFEISQISNSSIVNRLKSISTNRLWKRYKDYLKNHFWKEKTFWSDGYFVCSTGNANNMETIKKYIAKAKDHCVFLAILYNIKRTYI